MSARDQAPARTLERNALAAVLVRHAPRGAVRVAEALAATALNRRRRAKTLWNGMFADACPAIDALFAELPEQPISARADAAWNAACRRIAARAISGAATDPTGGAHWAITDETSPPRHGKTMTARIGPYAFYREDSGPG
jgi:N-acetylmuramoyl-L-alanine amidase